MVNDISPRTTALIAGLSLMAMAILASIANFAVLEKLIITGDARATAENIAASSTLFRSGIVLMLLVAVLDVVVAWALYGLLKPVHQSLALLMAWFRLSYAPAFALALSPLLTVVQLMENPGGLEVAQLHTQVALALSNFRNGWDIGLVLFGFHLLALGWLALKSGYLPRWLGALLLLAGLGYLADSFGRFLIPGYSFSVSVYTFVGEFLLIFWLLRQSFAAQPKVQTKGVWQ